MLTSKNLYNEYKCLKSCQHLSISILIPMRAKRLLVNLSEEGHTIIMPDERKLGYLIIGEGKPVFYFHGTPLSRLDVLNLRDVAYSRHLQMIGVDRPGFGLSTFKPDRTIRDFAVDVRFLADYLRIDRFSLIGYSSGGPYGIACAASMPDRVTRAIIIGGISLPIDYSELPKEVQTYSRLVLKPVIGTMIVKKQRDTFLKWAKAPDDFIKTKLGKKAIENFPESDQKFWTQPSDVRDLFFRSVVEAFRQESDSIRALIQEERLFQSEWDVDLRQIPPGVVYIWHGDADNSVPISNANRNAEMIPRPVMKIIENEGHFSSFFNHFGEICDLLG